MHLQYFPHCAPCGIANMGVKNCCGTPQYTHLQKKFTNTQTHSRTHLDSLATEYLLCVKCSVNVCTYVSIPKKRNTIITSNWLKWWWNSNNDTFMWVERIVNISRLLTKSKLKSEQLVARCRSLCSLHMSMHATFLSGTFTAFQYNSRLREIICFPLQYTSTHTYTIAHTWIVCLV